MMNAYSKAIKESRQQEWTPEYCKKSFGVSPKLSRDISFAINAAIAAEREETEAWKQNGLNAVAGLERELAAERERADKNDERAERWVFAAENEHKLYETELKRADKAEQQITSEQERSDEWKCRYEQAQSDSYDCFQRLVAAQAAMAEIYHCVNQHDLSALDKHDTELRKPMVDALELALIPIAAWKLTDTEKPYVEIGPDLRHHLLKAHDAIMVALAKVKR
jgi:hypothetical protein